MQEVERQLHRLRARETVAEARAGEPAPESAGHTTTHVSSAADATWLGAAGATRTQTGALE